MCRVNNKGKECESKERKLKAADRYGGPKCSSYKMTGQRAAAGKRQEWRMDGGDVTITEKSELICLLTRN